MAKIITIILFKFLQCVIQILNLVYVWPIFHWIQQRADERQDYQFLVYHVLFLIYYWFTVVWTVLWDIIQKNIDVKDFDSSSEVSQTGNMCCKLCLLEEKVLSSTVEENVKFSKWLLAENFTTGNMYFVC